MSYKGNRAATLAVISVLAASAAVSGCGGGSSTAADNQRSTVGGATITKAILITKGDAICRHTDVVQKKRFAAYEKKHAGESLLSSSAREKALAYAAMPPLATEIEGIATLGSPEGEVGVVDDIISGWRGALKRLEQKPSLLLSFTEGPFTRPDKLAGDFGFKDCAKAL
jgi:hypothetical protein